MKRLCLLLCALALSCTGGFSQLVSWDFTPGSIADGDTTPFSLPGAPAMDQVGSIAITINHTSARDLTVTFDAPGQPGAFVLFDGSSTDWDLVESKLGSNAAGTTPAEYTFKLSGADFLAAALAATTANIPSGSDFAAKQWLSGSIAAGTWTVQVADGFTGDLGALTRVEITAVPEPASMAAVAGMTLLGFVVYRRARAKS